MCSMENQNHLGTSKMLFDTIVSFKPNSELKRYIQLKTGITITFFTLGENHHRARKTIWRTKSCSNYLFYRVETSFKMQSFTCYRIKGYNYKSFSFCFWVPGGSKEPQKLLSNKQVFCHSCLDTQKGPVQTKNSFLWTNPKCKKS